MTFTFVELHHGYDRVLRRVSGERGRSSWPRGQDDGATVNTGAEDLGSYPETVVVDENAARATQDSRCTRTESAGLGSRF